MSTQHHAIAGGFECQELIVIEIIVIRYFPADFDPVAAWRPAGNDKDFLEVPDFIEIYSGNCSGKQQCTQHTYDGQNFFHC